jgi:HD superfamily phosphohydrolase
LLRSFTFGPPADGGGALRGSAAAPPLAIDGGKGIVALEAFVLARLFMFQQVYFHKAARAAEWMIGGIFSRVAHLLRDGTQVRDVPRALLSMAHGKKVSLLDYLELDDHVIHCAMHAWELAGDPILADLTSRVRRRALFKTLELYEKNTDQWQTALDVAREIARRRGLSPDCYVGLDVASDTPFREDDDPLAVVFPHGMIRKPSDVSFLLGRLCGETVTRARLIFAPELRDEIRSAVT